MGIVSSGSIQIQEELSHTYTQGSKDTNAEYKYVSSGQRTLGALMALLKLQDPLGILESNRT